jgi:putative phosphoribosyl transferase
MASSSQTSDMRRRQAKAFREILTRCKPIDWVTGVRFWRGKIDGLTYSVYSVSRHCSMNNLDSRRTVEPLFTNRLDAGRRLADALDMYRGSDAVVVGLARGGVEVGYAVAAVLHLPLTVLVVRKLGAPSNSELAIGAISESGAQWIDPEICEATGADSTYLRLEGAAQAREAARRRQEYARALPLSTVAGRPAIVVDDGIATGATAVVGLRSMRALGASTVILATPVASPHAVQLLTPEADAIIATEVPPRFAAVGSFYANFRQLSDEEVIEYLGRRTV